ncbi:biopolymer transporter ExbD [Desulfosarcina sp.]|uniref:ExbD/TolR family protein n=1 Tax=Desulfosarcina sp. TaxID=2027861 RepID=UPI0029A61B8C|nr:biopolymer transporter ExbD [Desulfosarcina sp.]MDX2453162.1 biopolymer transporter ExbD [Desulfosarcina sp.]MDX2490891.1 biopolymer transporter ExbD [Desulfosarcina sp.]
MDEKEFDYLNVIPLVDIMLVLLTIVLTTSTFIASGVIPVDLPKAGDKSVESMESQIIEIDRNGQVHINATAVSLLDLGIAIRGLDRSVAVMIRADRAIALQSFVDVLDLVKTLGFTKVHLQTESRL